ncbi:hypothetical protein Hypma_012589 [Hypsizygus marmoreus]|uniref:MFS general substrate transporter n=1 Tax=Hypsizygus marmoreus TaxID=39966 RepID=A0A369JDP7_HYPMA|nr:hypothetical protein Hypma_012589 [Hypsizygus marmoreus]
MATKPTQYPGLLSSSRITTLFASLIVALSSGSNYVFSAYAPQLAARLQITHTQLNIVGLAGNVGVYSSGPFWGRIVDSRGPRILLVSAFILLLSGYSGMKYIFDTGFPPTSTTISTLTFCLLVACSFMTGAGGNGSFTGSVNSTAKTFPDKARATATGIVISGFGLSAFFFSTISRISFAGNTSSFLQLLALGTSMPMIMGFFLVRQIPLPPVDSVASLEHAAEDAIDAGAMDVEEAENSALLEHAEVDDAATPVQLSRRAALSQGLLPNVYGRKLWTSSDFWLLFLILSILSGTGLMYINNVGSMAQALYAKDNSHYDPVEAAHWQTAQVSSISLMNFSGRIFIGLVSDITKNRLSLPRSYSLTLVSSFFFLSQVAAANVDNIKNLWIASGLLGLAHGSAFSLFPTVCIEWFGLPHFSENWGYLSASPILAANLFSVAFGRNLDAHDRTPSETGHPGPVSGLALQCLEGRQCYVDTLYLTVGVTFLSVLLSIWAGWRDRSKIVSSREKFANSRGEMVWENSERD